MFNLTPFIPVFPLIAFVLIIFGANRSNKLSAWLAILGIGASTVVSWLIVAATIADHHIQIDGWNLSIPWIPMGSNILDTGFAVDGFTAAMLFMVPFVCTLIFIYASEYMQGDPRYARFFAYVSLFAFGMLTLVVANNLLLLFMAWEIMGLCSYLLIGFWFEKESARQAALKAFLTTRVGDILFFSGMILLYVFTGTLTFREIFEPHVLEDLAHNAVVFGLPAASVISLLIFGGAMGKSAQFPLHVWLPDAMEGPTPVSAMIHAATMVSAGVYLIARMLPLFQVSGSEVMGFVTIIGAITALLGATIGLAQRDIKRVLAFSTISQLGYMFIALGTGSFLAGAFHMLTHAFFKALLFLGAGSVIHAVEHGAHEVHDHHTDPQDMFNMGGLRKKMRASFYAYFAGTLALVGIFPLSGFWSKDEILAHAWHEAHGISLTNPAFWAYLAGALGAFLTALYMGRQIGLVFFGKARSEAAAHAHQPGRRMTWVLIVLAGFAVLGGLANIPESFPVLGPLFGNGFLHHFAGEVHEVAEVLNLEATAFNWNIAISSTILAVIGFLGGIFLYKGLEAGQKDPLQKALGPIYTLLANKFYIDEFYNEYIVKVTADLATFSAKIDYDWVINPIVNTVGRFTVWFSWLCGKLDQIVVDGVFVEGTGKVVNWLGKELRMTQTGRAQNYLLVIALSSLTLVGAYLFLIRLI